MRRFGFLITAMAAALDMGCTPPLAGAPDRTIAADLGEQASTRRETLDEAATWAKLDDGRQPGDDAPTAGEDAKIAYDPQRGCVYLYGGKDDDDRNSDELWSFDVKTRRWSRVASDGSKPPPREDHSLVLDTGNDRLMLFGGEDGQTSNETWAYDLSTNRWENITHTSAPARQEHIAVYDPRGRRMLVFGGTSSDRTPDDQTHVLDLDRKSATFQTWSTLPPSDARPPWRRQHAAVYDPARHRMLMFGGIQSKKRYLNDLWSLDLDADHWSQVEPRGDQPPPIAQTALSLSPQRDELIVFGGEVLVVNGGDADSYLVNHIWSLNLRTGIWSDVTPHPPVVYDHAGVFVPDLDGMLMYGGSNFRSGKEHGTWLLKASAGPEASRGGADQ
jgi:hypothetical protein